MCEIVLLRLSGGSLSALMNLGYLRYSNMAHVHIGIKKAGVNNTVMYIDIRIIDHNLR